RRGPLLVLELVHRRPAVDEAHQVERAPGDGGVVAHGNGLGVGYVGPLEGGDDAPLPQDPVVPVSRRFRRRDADGAAQLAAMDVVELVLRAAREQAVLDGLTLARWDVVVHPRRQPLEVDHKFPTSCSRYSANLALAASTFP